MMPNEFANENTSRKSFLSKGSIMFLRESGFCFAMSSIDKRRQRGHGVRVVGVKSLSDLLFHSGPEFLPVGN